MKDKKQNIDKIFGDRLKRLQPEVNTSDWNAIVDKMKSNQVNGFGEQLKNLKPKTSSKDWEAIMAKMPPVSTKQKIAWWWLPVMLTIVLIGYPGLRKIDQYVHVKERNNQIVLNNNQFNQNHKLPTTNERAAENIELEHNKINTDKQRSLRSEISTEKFPSGPSRKDEKQKTKINIEKAQQEQSGNKSEKKSLPELNLYFKSISLFTSTPIEIGAPLSVNKDLKTWPKIITPQNKGTEFLNNLSFTPLISINRYTSNFNSEDRNWQNKRTQAEKPVILPDVGIKVSSSIAKISLNSGVIYSLKGQKIDGNVTYQLYDSFPHLDPNGKIIDYFRLNYRDTTVQAKLTNTYSYIDIPFNFGYTFKLNEQHSLTPTIGSTISIFTRAKGQSIAPNLGFHNIANTSLYHYRKIMSSWQLQLNYNYTITDKILLETGVQYRKNINGIYRSGYDAKERLMNVGFSFGLNYRF